MFLKLFHFLIPLWCLWFAEPTDPPTSDPAKDAGTGSGTEDKKSFTQAELDRMFTERAKQATQSAISGLLQKLGLAKEDELETLVKTAKDAETARLSDLEKAQKERDGLKAEADKAKADGEKAITLANERVMRSEVIAEASNPEHKFRPEAIKDVWAFVDRSKLTVNEETGEVEGAADAVKKVAKDKPYMVQQGQTTATVGTPPRTRTIAGQTSQVQPVNGTPTQYEEPLVRF